MTTSRILGVTLWILCSFMDLSFHVVKAQESECESFTSSSHLLSGSTCYLVPSSVRRTYTAAEEYCRVEYPTGSAIAAADTEVAHVALVVLMERENAVTDMWLGMRKQPTELWMWSYNNSLTSHQGCFTDQEPASAMGENIPLMNMFPSTCVAECTKRNTKYAGVQRGEDCRCSDTYGTLGITDGCTTSCLVNDRYTCGGWLKNDLYYIGGAYVNWTYNQPNNHDGNQLCGCLDDENDKYGMVDMPCDGKFLYVCEIFASCSGTLGGSYLSSSSGCYFLSSGTATWMEAHKDCHQRFGRLLVVKDRAQHDAVIALVRGASNSATRYYWIGLTRLKWEWSNGAYLGFTNFKFESPTKYYFIEECIRMTKSSGFLWSEDECSLRKNYACQIETDQCVSSPCRNFGVCVDGHFSYTCDCIPGYTGTNCQIEIEECASSPCMNGGRCIDGVNEFSCVCTDRYTGVRCQIDTLSTKAPVTATPRPGVSTPAPSGGTPAPGGSTPAPGGSTLAPAVSTPAPNGSATTLIPPTAGKSTEEDSIWSNPLLIALLVIAIILLIAVIIGIIIFVYYKKQQPSRRVYPVSDNEKKYIKETTVADEVIESSRLSDTQVPRHNDSYHRYTNGSAGIPPLHSDSDYNSASQLIDEKAPKQKEGNRTQKPSIEETDQSFASLQSNASQQNLLTSAQPHATSSPTGSKVLNQENAKVGSSTDVMEPNAGVPIVAKDAAMMSAQAPSIAESSSKENTEEERAQNFIPDRTYFKPEGTDAPNHDVVVRMSYEEDADDAAGQGTAEDVGSSTNHELLAVAVVPNYAVPLDNADEKQQETDIKEQKEQEQKKDKQDDRRKKEEHKEGKEKGHRERKNRKAGKKDKEAKRKISKENQVEPEQDETDTISDEPGTPDPDTPDPDTDEDQEQQVQTTTIRPPARAARPKSAHPAPSSSSNAPTNSKDRSKSSHRHRGKRERSHSASYRRYSEDSYDPITHIVQTSFDGTESTVMMTSF